MKKFKYIYFEKLNVTIKNKIIFFFLFIFLNLYIFNLNFVFSQERSNFNQSSLVESLLDQLELSSDQNISKKLKDKIWSIWNYNFKNENAGKFFFLAMKHLNQGNLIMAEMLLSKSIQKDPLYTEARNKRALIKFLKEDFEGSEKDLLLVLQYQKRHFGAIYGLGLIYIENEKYLDAIKQFEKLKKIDPMNEENRKILFKLENEFVGKKI